MSPNVTQVVSGRHKNRSQISRTPKSADFPYVPVSKSYYSAV